ncbi:MAG: hypothetical protein H5T86_05125 [Armatimonadetes bacterium]|nr:hypothetical protein [Armatimonadota bacterium]
MSLYDPPPPSGREVSLLPSSPCAWALLGLTGALAGSAAATVQPASFTVRQGAGFVAIAVAAVVCSFAARRVGIAWPLLCGLALTAAYRLSYEPALPEPIMARLPMRVALLEPTGPMLLVLFSVAAWAVLLRDRPRDPAFSLARRALCRAGLVAVGLGLIYFVAFAGIYNLEGGYWFWRLILASVLYLGLMWVGVEAAARGTMGPVHAALLFAGIMISVGRALAGGQGA